jgi:DNA-binding winged helix-turn-helix (wHTH) protein
MSGASSDVHAYRFGPFELRPHDFALTRDRAALRLSPKAFDTLRLLLERRGDLVSKEELIATLWPDTVVEESNLTVHISAIRKVLGRDVSASYIETVPKRGYRFHGPVEVVRADRLAPAAPPAVHEAPSIAVVPLKILSSHPDADFLAFALPDAIAASIVTRTPILARSPLAAAEHGGAEATLSGLAEALGAGFALTGTLRSFDGRVEVNLRLLSVPAGVVLWAESYAVATAGLFDLQARVAMEVVGALTSAFGGSAAAARSDEDIPKGTAAYAFYLRANQLAYEVRSWMEARDLYRASLDADPGYAPAWAGLGRCERLIGKFASSAEAATTGLTRAEHAFQQALALNPDLAVGHSLYAQLLIDTGRADEAMHRLIGRLARRPADAEL